MNDKTVFVQFFGEYPIIKVLDFFIQNRIFDYSKSEIAEGADIGWSTLHMFWDKLEESGIVLPTRRIGKAKLFRLNTENPGVKNLINFGFNLAKQAARIEAMKSMEEPVNVPV